jgi:predicted phosphoribosyltransferase
MFKHRQEAGRLLAQRLKKYRNTHCIVYALPRGGVIIGHEIAKSLSAPLDLVITRKIAHPLDPEYAIGAVSESGELQCDEYEQKAVGMQWINEEAMRQMAEAKRRRQTYLGRKSFSPKGKIAIIVDDGVATGFSIGLAIREIQKQKPAKIVVAVPVIPDDTAKKLAPLVDELIALEIGKPFLGSIGQYYHEFPQIEDEEVIVLLWQSRGKARAKTTRNRHA